MLWTQEMALPLPASLCTRGHPSVALDQSNLKGSNQSPWNPFLSLSTLRSAYDLPLPLILEIVRLLFDLVVQPVNLFCNQVGLYHSVSSRSVCFTISSYCRNICLLSIRYIFCCSFLFIAVCQFLLTLGIQASMHTDRYCWPGMVQLLAQQQRSANDQSDDCTNLTEWGSLYYL